MSKSWENEQMKELDTLDIGTTQYKVINNIIQQKEMFLLMSKEKVVLTQKKQCEGVERSFKTIHTHICLKLKAIPKIPYCLQHTRHRCKNCNTLTHVILTTALWGRQ